MDFFSEYPTRYPALLCALLTSICAYETFRRASGDEVDKAWGDISLFCQLALSSRSTKILSTGKLGFNECFMQDFLIRLFAAILSSYVIVTHKQLVEDPLTCAEVASAIISVLLLTLTNCILADELPLALLSSPCLCRSLTTLIHVAGDDLGKSFPPALQSSPCGVCPPLTISFRRLRILPGNHTMDAQPVCRVEDTFGCARGRIVH